MLSKFFFKIGVASKAFENIIIRFLILMIKIFFLGEKLVKNGKMNENKFKKYRKK